MAKQVTRKMYVGEFTEEMKKQGWKRDEVTDSLGDLKDKVVNASDLAFPSITPTQFEKYSESIQALINLKAKKVEIESSGIKNTGNWVFGEMPQKSDLLETKEPVGNHVGYDGIPSNRQIVALIDYCNQNNLIPEDLIAFHKKYSKKKK